MLLNAFTAPVQARKLQTGWEPTPCSEVEKGQPCYKLYEHPQGSQLVMPCPVDSQNNAEACKAQFEGKGDGEQCHTAHEDSFPQELRRETLRFIVARQHEDFVT